MVWVCMKPMQAMQESCMYAVARMGWSDGCYSRESMSVCEAYVPNQPSPGVRRRKGKQERNLNIKKQTQDP